MTVPVGAFHVNVNSFALLMVYDMFKFDGGLASVQPSASVDQSLFPPAFVFNTR